MAQYTESIISYFDILGFKSLVARSSDPEDVARKLRALKRHATTDNEIAEMYGSTFTNFSDLVLRTVPVEQQVQTAGTGTLFWELVDLVHVQAELIRDGILLRGAVTVGKIYIQDGIAFGPGLIRAYELESTVALYPRVIVDPIIFEKLHATPSLGAHSYEEDIAYLRQVLSKDSDGIWYVDYLRAFESEADSPNKYMQLLCYHRDLIVNAVQGISELNSVAVKYGWLINYHNRWVGRLPEEFVTQAGQEKKDLYVFPETSALPTLVTGAK